MNPLEERLAEMTPWYHEVSLEPTIPITTKGWEGVKPQWENTRRVRASVDYRGRHVLDIGSRDGMWAFEAEELGADAVVATDIGDLSFYEHILFARFCRRSKIAVYWNVSVEDLSRLDCYFRYGGHNRPLFDIVQHLGVLYHLENPMASLRECRRVMKDGGILILETAFMSTESDTPLARFNSDSGIYRDVNTFWAFNKSALVGALKLCGFHLTSSLDNVVYQNDEIQRICLTAEAV
jgi:tRNA (mo5U34)-methyltransferase